jgi:hypothetical protein
VGKFLRQFLASVWKALTRPALDRRLRRQAVVHRARRAYSGREATAACAAFIAKAFGLKPPDHEPRWPRPGVALTRRFPRPVELPDGLSAWHLPLLDIVSRMPFDSRILELYCGIPLLLCHLHRRGFEHLTGVEDSCRSRGIVEAARAFLTITQTDARLIDVALLPDWPVKEILAGHRPFDLIASFGAADRLWFPLVWELLNDGGLFVAESYFAEVPREFRHRFETVESYPDLGFRLHAQSELAAVAVFRKLPAGTPRMGEGLEKRDGDIETFRGPDAPRF